MVYIGYLSGLFTMLEGGLVGCICCCIDMFRGFIGILGVIVWLFVIYLVFRVRGGGCMLHTFGQSWLQLGWQKSCSAMFNALFSNFVGVL